MPIINYEAKEIMLDKIKEFNISEDDLNKRMHMREEFVSVFNTAKIKALMPEEYFPGLGKKEDCVGYQLEWATRPLGSIKGGSMSKYGPKEQFEEIKNLLIKLTQLEDDRAIFYGSGGELTKQSLALIEESKKIRGMKSGRTVLGKLLSIYYPNIFIPIFTDQDYILNLIVKDFSEDSVGLESYMKNNYMFLKIVEELLSEPAFTKVIGPEKFSNHFFYKFVYYCFPRTKEDEALAEAKRLEEQKIEALEVEHYQKLIHRNFNQLFRGYKYFDEEVQNAHEGHYSTEDAGIMDFLCLNEDGNFVVIELKRRGTDETLAQLCRYMGWVKENLADEKQKVLGTIVSETKDIKLEYAVKVVPHVDIKHMKLDVTIGDF